MIDRRTRNSLALLAVAAVIAAAPQTASAGSYVIAGCNGWNAYNWAPTHIAVYAHCPGFTARHVLGNFASPVAAEGGWTFAAPPGTSIAEITMTGYFLGLGGWQTKAWAEGGGSPGGFYDFEECPSIRCPGNIDYLATYPLPGATSLRLRVRCGAASCRNNDLAGAIELSGVAVKVYDYLPPSLSITGGSLVNGTWRAGTHTVSADASDNTGIQMLRAYIDGSRRAEQARACAWGAYTPCPNGGGTLALATTGLSDGPHQLTVEVVDSGGLTATRDATVYVDNVAPGPPLATTVIGGNGWRATDAFAVRWTDPRQNAAPITAALYRFCPSGTADTSRCKAGEIPRKPGTEATTLRVPAPGDWRLQLWLRDAAGNQTPANAVTLEHLRFDSTPPTAKILPIDPNDPTRIRVAASDDLSGIAGGEVEVQLDGENLWRTLPTQIVADGLAAAFDDSQFPDGAYRVRARVNDAAGNERSAVDTKPSLTLPLRIKTRLAVGKVKRVRAKSARGKRPRYRRILVDRPRARYGRTIRLSGRLTTPGANPVAGVPVEVFEQVQLPGAPWTRIATVNTSRTGRFTFKALRGPSRLVQFRYGGTAIVRPRTTTVALQIRGSTSLDVNRHRVVNGEDVVFRGHVRGRPLPPQGKLVELQVYTRGRWRTFAQPRAHAGTGRWSYRYRFEAIRGQQRFRFRARVRKESGYPYELGTSQRIGIRVRGQ